MLAESDRINDSGDDVTFDLMAESKWTRRLDRLGVALGGLVGLCAILMILGDIVRPTDPVVADNIGLAGFFGMIIGVPLFVLWAIVELVFRMLRAAAVSIGWIVDKAPAASDDAAAGRPMRRRLTLRRRPRSHPL